MPTKSENAQRMFSMIENWKSSGESQQAFCKSQGLVYSVFHYWYKKYREAHNTLPTSSSFVPVDINPVLRSSPVMELVLPDGKRINFYQAMEASYLRTLLF